MFYEFLYDLDDNDDFWDNSLGGFDKLKCFKNYTTINENNDYKKWYKDNKTNFGRMSVKLFNCWIKHNASDYDKFIKDFKKAFNRIALKNGFDEIMVK